MRIPVTQLKYEMKMVLLMTQLIYEMTVVLLMTQMMFKMTVVLLIEYGIYKMTRKCQMTMKLLLGESDMVLLKSRALLIEYELTEYEKTMDVSVWNDWCWDDGFLISLSHRHAHFHAYFFKFVFEIVFLTFWEIVFCKEDFLCSSFKIIDSLNIMFSASAMMFMCFVAIYSVEYCTTN